MSNSDQSGVDPKVSQFRADFDLIEISKQLCAMNDLGCDLSQFGLGATATKVMLRVGRGEACSEILPLLADRVTVCEKIAFLPLDAQKKIVEEQALEVYEEIDGRPSYRMVPLDQLTSLQAKIAINDIEKRLYTREEQSQRFTEQTLESRMKRSRNIIEYDETTDAFRAKNVTLAEVEQWIKEHKDRRGKPKCK